MKYRADINTREQLTESVEIVDFEYIYAPMEFLNSDTPEKPRIIAVLPVFLGEDELKIAEKLRELKSMGFRGALAHTLGHIELIKSAGLQAHGGFRLNITNSLSQRKYEELGLSDGIFSVELSFRRISAIEKNIPMGIMAYGRLPLMILRRCPVNDRGLCGKSGCNALTDRLGNRFKTSCRFDEVEVLNPNPLVLSDKQINTDFAVLKFTGGENITEILHGYQSKAEPYGNFTRGLYYRKVN